MTWEEESSVKRMISWRERVPRWRWQLHTFCEEEERALGEKREAERGVMGGEKGGGGLRRRDPRSGR